MVSDVVKEPYWIFLPLFIRFRHLFDGFHDASLILRQVLRIRFLELLLLELFCHQHSCILSQNLFTRFVELLQVELLLMCGL